MLRWFLIKFQDKKLSMNVKKLTINQKLLKKKDRYPTKMK